MVTPRIPPTLRCPVCDGTRFDEKLSRTDGKRLTGRYKMTLMVCSDCAYIYPFLGWR